MKSRYILTAFRPIALAACMSAVALPCLSQSVDEQKIFPITSAMLGKHLRIVVIGGGGGGSGGTADAWIARSGAGGGSGGVSGYETKIVKTGDLKYSVGRGGSGGVAFGFAIPGSYKSDAPRSGSDGGATSVTLPSGEKVTAYGGRGGVDIASGYNSGVQYNVEIPPIGGFGGEPNGRWGGDGAASFRFSNTGEVLSGGIGGRYEGVEYGAGGVGGGAATLTSFAATGNPIATPYAGAPGKDGHVEIDVSDVAFMPLTYLKAPSNASGVGYEVQTYNPQAVSAFLRSFSGYCVSQPNCASKFLIGINAAAEANDSPAQRRWESMAAGSEAELIRFLWKFVSLYIPETIEIIPVFILNGVGDAKVPGPGPVRPPNPLIDGADETRLNELIGFSVIASVQLQKQAGANIRYSLIALQSLRESATRELDRRQKYRIGAGYRPISEPSSPSGAGSGRSEVNSSGAGSSSSPSTGTISVPRGGAREAAPTCNKCVTLDRILFCMGYSEPACVLQP